ncbi:zinc ABC transporter substrate-binding protein [Roseibaca sp. V10]|uniref:High-affinity zinc uptake system protein ZnuA n=1 Tax=Roseinatronobacter domitianus TaxID=2940293 RepID=A0ABT0M4R2_9RHOB|nr:zinc ABC transporter substrate-binding protein [Roseibaca domitiana]MCL1629284.1 zinc ABC transporter substrate-binding protein [Roseibaca domitiana]
MRYSIALAAAMLGTPLAAHELRVVTDIPVAHSLVSMVLGDHGTADLMLDRGANAHSYQLRPSQAQALSQADVVVWIGEEMTPWMGRAISGLGGDAHSVALLEVDGVLLREFGQAKDAKAHDEHAHEDDHGHAHEDDHGHEHDHHGDDAHTGEHGHDAHSHDDHGHEHASHDHGHDDHGHDDHGHDHGDDHAHSGLDPHAWLDTRIAINWVDAIATELAEHMPDHAADFAANADSAKAEIAALTAEIDTLLAPARDMAFVTFHDAYGYFVNQFDLMQAGSIALGDAASPGAQRLAALRADMQADAAVCIFPEAAHDPALVTTMIDGTGVRLGATLDPAGSLLEPGAGLYGTLMRNMAQAIADCAQG